MCLKCHASGGGASFDGRLGYFRNIPRGQGYRTGATLIELLIVAGVLLVISAVGFSLLLKTSQATQRGSLRVEMQQQAQVSMAKLVDDMKHSCCAGVSVRSTAPKAIAICPVSRPDVRAGELSPVQADGVLRWSSFFQFYYYDAPSQEFRYAEWPNGSVVATALETSILNPRRLGVDRMAAILSGSLTHPKRLATGVTQFDLLHPSGGSDALYIQPLTIKMTLQRRGNTGNTAAEMFTLARTVFLEDQR